MNTDEIVFGVSLGNTELVIYNWGGRLADFSKFQEHSSRTSKIPRHLKNAKYISNSPKSRAYYSISNKMGLKEIS